MATAQNAGAPPRLVGRYESPEVVGNALASVDHGDADLELWYVPGEPAVVVDLVEPSLEPDLAVERWAVDLNSGAALSSAHSRFATPDEVEHLAEAIVGSFRGAELPTWAVRLADLLSDYAARAPLGLDEGWRP